MSQGRLSTQLAEMQRLHRAGFASKSAGMLTSRTTDGIIRKPAWRPKARGAAASVKRFKIVSVQTNYLTCNPYDAAGTVDTGSTVYVAKPPVLRDSDGERTRTVGSSTVTEEIRTNYAVNDDIYAIESSMPTGVTDGDSNAVTWLDLNVDARNWQPKFVEVEGCDPDTGATKYRRAVAGSEYDVSNP